MNRFVYSSLFILSWFATWSQVTIPTTHMPTIGDVFTYAVHNQTYTPKPSSGGLYDFSDLRQDDTTVFRYVANDKTVEFPNSNLKFIEDDNDEATVFFEKSENDLFLISIGALQQQLPVPGASLGSLKGTMKYASYPMTNALNMSSSDTVKTTIPKSLFQGFNIDSMIQSMIPGLPAGSQLIVDSIGVEIIFTLNFRADGSGKIKTPIDNNLDVLKVIRVISGTPKIILYAKAKLGPIEIPIVQNLTDILSGQLPLDNFNITTHTYYSPSYRQDILTATLDSTGKYESVNYRYRTKDGAITNHIQSNISNNLDIELRHGSLGIINMKPSETAQVRIYSVDGKKLQEKLVFVNDSELILSPWSGTILVHIATNSGIVVKKISSQ